MARETLNRPTFYGEPAQLCDAGTGMIKGSAPITLPQKFLGFFNQRLIRETLNRSTFYGEPAQLCDAGISKIKVLAPLILPQKFPHFFNQRFL